MVGWNERSDALAVWLAQDCHVARRSHVAILLQNVPDFIVAVLAIWKLGAVPMPLDPMYKQQELGRLFADSGPCAVVCHAGAGGRRACGYRRSGSAAEHTNNCGLPSRASGA